MVTVEQLKREGMPGQDSDLVHVWPTRYAHLNMYGKYHFNVEPALAPKMSPFHRKSL